MTPEQRIARGKQAETALEQFLSPAFEHVITAYLSKLQDIAAEQPWEVEKIRKLAAATKIARTVQEQIVAFVRDGEAAGSAKKAADKIAAMPEERRRWALAAGGFAR